MEFTYFLDNLTFFHKPDLGLNLSGRFQESNQLKAKEYSRVTITISHVLTEKFCLGFFK